MSVVYGAYFWNKHILLCSITSLIKVQQQGVNKKKHETKYMKYLKEFNIYNKQTFYRKPVNIAGLRMEET